MLARHGEDGYTTVVLHSLLSNLVAQMSNLVSCIEPFREEGYTTVVLHPCQEIDLILRDCLL